MEINRFITGSVVHIVSFLLNLIQTWMRKEMPRLEMKNFDFNFTKNNEIMSSKVFVRCQSKYCRFLILSILGLHRFICAILGQEFVPVLDSEMIPDPQSTLQCFPADRLLNSCQPRENQRWETPLRRRTWRGANVSTAD